MDYKYMRVFQYNGETRGVATNHGNDQDLQSEQVNPMDYTILHKRIQVLEGNTYVDARLEDGFYPYKHFEEAPPLMADYIPEGQQMKSHSGPHTIQYIGSKADKSVNQ